MLYQFSQHIHISLLIPSLFSIHRELSQTEVKIVRAFFVERTPVALLVSENTPSLALLAVPPPRDIRRMPTRRKFNTSFIFLSALVRHTSIVSLSLTSRLAEGTDTPPRLNAALPPRRPETRIVRHSLRSEQLRLA